MLMSFALSKAQYDPSFSHYWEMEPSFNPASVGKERKINVGIAYSMALTGFENNPKTMYAGADMPFYFMKSYHGVGVQLLNDQIGLFSHQRFALQYAFKRHLWGGLLGIGAQLGMVSEKFEGTKVDLETPDDPAIPTTDVTGSGFDLGFGLYYACPAWYAGLSVLHATSPSVDLGEKQSLTVDRTFYLTGGYNIKLRNPFFTIKPSLLARTDGVGYRVDLTGRFVYTNDKKMMYGGVAYSPTNSVTLMIGGNFHGVTLGYSYEAYTSAISLGNGAHEIFIGYQTDINLGKKGHNMHKSVRFL